MPTGIASPIEKYFLIYHNDIRQFYIHSYKLNCSVLRNDNRLNSNLNLNDQKSINVPKRGPKLKISYSNNLCHNS